MFTIILKHSRAEIEILTTRVLLAIAGVAAIILSVEGSLYLSLVISGLFFLSSFFIKTILAKLKVHRLILLAAAALLIFVATHSVVFAIVLFAHGIFFGILNKRTKVDLDGKAINIHYVFNRKTIPWNALNNVILKDGILTLDFKNYRLLQSEISDESSGIDEKIFNNFCQIQLQNHNTSI